MTLILMILSVLAGWTFLGALATGLVLIVKALEGVRTSLERIAMGVRAIEKQMAPLGEQAERLTGSLGQAGGTVRMAADGLSGVGRKLDRAAPGLRSAGATEGHHA